VMSAVRRWDWFGSPLIPEHELIRYANRRGANPVLDNSNHGSRSDKEDDPPHEPRGTRPPGAREEADAEPNAD
jgi:hypothetical protein